jgi:CheY-like chemotaxis protein
MQSQKKALMTSKRILVVDDDPTLRGSLQAWLIKPFDLRELEQVVECQ